MLSKCICLCCWIWNHPEIQCLKQQFLKQQIIWSLFWAIRLGSIKQFLLSVLSDSCRYKHLSLNRGWVAKHNYSSSSGSWHLLPQSFQPAAWESKDVYYNFRKTLPERENKCARPRYLQLILQHYIGQNKSPKQPKFKEWGNTLQFPDRRICKVALQRERGIIVVFCANALPYQETYFKIFINYWHTLCSTYKSWML